MTTNSEIFDAIAESWYRVRHWPLLKEELAALAAKWQSGKLLNIGCAHGPDFLPFGRGFDLWGLDCSPAMVGQAGRFAAKCEFYVNLMVADALFLPFPDNTFDWAISVATYHHIKGEEERERAFRELRRVLKPQGEAFLTVWNHGQTRFWFTPKEQQIPWKLKEKTVYRYYYLFSYGELRRILIKTGWKIVALSAEESHRFPIKSFSRNICVLVRKD